MVDWGPLPSGQRLDHLAPAAVSQGHRLFSNGWERRDNGRLGETKIKKDLWKGIIGTASKSASSDPSEDAERRPEEQSLETSSPESTSKFRNAGDPIQHQSQFKYSAEKRRKRARKRKRKKCLRRLSERGVFSKWLNPDNERFLSTAKLFRKVFRTSVDSKFDWHLATMLTTPRPRTVKKMEDESRDAVESPSVARLVHALWSARPPSTHYLFQLYRAIPSPGVAQLSKPSRGALLRRFASPILRRWVDARRYLALVEDMITAGLPMSRSLWSSAIYLAGRASGRGLKKDLLRAIGIWQQMEHVAGIPADDVVFNILFDIAIKAGQFTVADRLQEEMTKRGIDFSRCGKVSKIYCHGRRQDAGGVRKSFDEFVQSGELVDTVVLNCVMAAFLRAGDVQTAEQLYARMIESQKSRPRNQLSLADNDPQPSLTTQYLVYHQKNKKLGRLLKKSAALKERLPEYHRALQDAISTAPDTRTFSVFLRHYACETGQLDSYMAVLRDMERTFAVPPRPMIYFFLFEGFALHGRKKRQWCAERLRLVWHAYLRALRDSKARLHGLLLHAPKKDKIVWENPLASTIAVDAQEDVLLPNTPDGLYVPLPFNAKAKPSTEETSVNSKDNPEIFSDAAHRTEKDTAIIEDQINETAEKEDLDVDEIFSKQHAEYEVEGPNHLEYHVENGVFVGRRMIIIILRAFGTCCGPKEVMEVWLQLERLWHPNRRKAVDVLAVKEELDTQMARNPR